MNQQVSFKIKFHNWGYWAGGFFCLLGIFALSLGVTPLITAAREKLKMAEFPGRLELEFKIPGTYIAICVSKNLGSETVQRVRDIEYFLTDKDEQENIEIAKIPARAYFSEKEENQLPLFQFVIEKKGKYVLVSNYPYEMEGPKIQAVLLPIDIRYVRAELIVGIVLFLIFGFLGFYFIRKTVKENRR